RLRLANGGGASMEEGDALAKAPFLVVSDVTGSAANGRIRAAAEIDRATIEELFAERISDEETLTFDAGAKAVRARKVRRYGALRLGDAPAKIVDNTAAAEVFAEGMVAHVGTLPWSREQKALRARSTYLHQQLGDDWPDLSDAGLARTDWLAGLGRTALSEVTGDDLEGALQSLLPW